MIAIATAAVCAEMDSRSMPRAIVPTVPGAYFPRIRTTAK